MPKKPNLTLPQPLESYSENVFHEIATCAVVLWWQAEHQTVSRAEIERLARFGCRRLAAFERLISRRLQQDLHDPLNILPDEAAMTRFDNLVVIFLTAVEKIERLLQRQNDDEREVYDVLLSEIIIEEES